MTLRAFLPRRLIGPCCVVALAVVATGAYGGAQQEEALSSSVQASLHRAVSDYPAAKLNFSTPTEGEAWLHEMSRRLATKIPDWPTRRDFLITVQYEATRAGLDPQLVLGLIQHESNFRKYAVSSASARGYMQVMPFWVKQIGNADHDLFNLRTNLRYGCIILRRYLDVESGDYFRALGRYNGSLGRAEYPNAVLAAWQRNWSWTPHVAPPADARAAQAPATVVR
ncbi:MAG: lytic transglycosylase domain-containing protein [Casimicrobiaceae bacterium]